MYGGNRDEPTATNTERTAFRQAEKRYKLCRSSSTLKSRSKQEKQYLETDISQVVDFDSVLRAHRLGEDLPSGTYRFQCPKDPSHHPIFCFHDRPGFYFIPGALSIEEQCSWIKASLKSFPQPPNRTNHTAIYGPLWDLLSAVENERVLVQLQNSFGREESCSDLNESKYIFTEKSNSKADSDSCKAIPASVLLRRLRWSILGLQYDWSKPIICSAVSWMSEYGDMQSVLIFVNFRRSYDISLPNNKVHDALCLLSKEMAAPAMPYGEEFHPEAAIVNYFGPSDMLGRHLDDVEADWSKPIVSISLGCKAIFLLGGKSRGDTPVAMFLRTGDIVLMAGEARECYHGVPRIFTDEENSDISALLLKLSDEEGNATISEYLKTSRININIRQVN